MTPAAIFAALALPDATRVDRRVSKSLLLEHGAPTAADKRRINEGIDQVTWVAALKPTTVGIGDYRDDLREYLEIAVLHVVLRQAAKIGRLTELLHRAVPYPVFVVTEHGAGTHFSLAHKRWSLGEGGKTVVDGEIVAADCTATDDEMHVSAFLSALALGKQPQKNLFALYEGWIDTLLALRAARRTGTFSMPTTGDHFAARREALQECDRFELEIARLRAAATKEKQVARQVELNLELRRLETARAAALARL